MTFADKHNLQLRGERKFTYDIIFLVHQMDLNGSGTQQYTITKSAFGKLIVQVIHSPLPVHMLKGGEFRVVLMCVQCNVGPIMSL